MSYFAKKLRVEYSSLRVRTLDGHQINIFEARVLPECNSDDPPSSGLMCYFMYTLDLMLCYGLNGKHLENQNPIYFVMESMVYTLVCIA